MKKRTIVTLMVTLSCFLVACAKPIDNTRVKSSKQEDSSQTQNNNANEVTNRKMKMTIQDEEVLIVLNDSAEATALYESLPLDLSFKDFHGSEKIAYLPEGKTLPVTSSVDGYDPSVGDLCLYAPWGNLCIFYQEQGIAEGLILLGHMETGLDILSNIEDGTTISLSKN